MSDLVLMKQRSAAEVLAEARQNTVGNRKALKLSAFAGCISCCARFAADEVTAWQVEADAFGRQTGSTALCPRCGQRSLIGSSTGLLDDPGYEPIIKTLFEREELS